jgi:pilus assembly protein CpaE
MFELVSDLEGADPDVVNSFTVAHSSGIHVVLAPPSPEMADAITPAAVKQVVEALRQRYELVVIDCAAWFNDTTLGILDLADVVLTVLTLEITSIKNIRLFLEVAEKLGYDDKIRLVLNRADTTLGIRVADVEHSIGRKVDNTIVSDGRAVVYALNRGVPFVLSNREAQVSQDVLRLAIAMTGPAASTGNREAREEDHKATQKGKSLFAWR